MAALGPYTPVIYIPTSQEALETVELGGVKVIRYRCKKVIKKELDNQ